MPREPHLRGRGLFLDVFDTVRQYDFEPGYVVCTMPAPKRLRVQAAGDVIADTTQGLVLFESDHIPIYYFPIDDVAMDRLELSDYKTHCPYKGEASHYSLKDQNGAYDNVGWHYRDPVDGCPDIANYLSFYFHDVDHWYEEDEEIFVHARDPLRRVDCLPSSRRVQVFLDGEEVADSSNGIFLFETGNPTRYYLPKEDVRRDLLTDSDWKTQCPYKGEAGYYHMTVKGKRHENVVWYYAAPVREASPVQNLVSFTNEFMDKILVNGVEQPRPKTGFSHGYNYHGYKD